MNSFRKGSLHILRKGRSRTLHMSCTMAFGGRLDLVEAQFGVSMMNCLKTKAGQGCGVGEGQRLFRESPKIHLNLKTTNESATEMANF